MTMVNADHFPGLASIVGAGAFDAGGTADQLVPGTRLGTELVRAVSHTGRNRARSRLARATALAEARERTCGQETWLGRRRWWRP